MPTLAATLLKNWKLVLGGAVLAALGLMLLLAKADARHWRKVAADREAAWNLEVAKHSITRQSVATLQSALADKNAESLARAKAFEDAKRKGEADLAALNARYAAGEGARARLEAILRNPPSAACRVPDELLDGIGGL